LTANHQTLSEANRVARQSCAPLIGADVRRGSDELKETFIMSTKSAIAFPVSPQPDVLSKLRKQYSGGPIELTGTPNSLYEHHLVFDNVLDSSGVCLRDHFEAIARSVRDILSQRWIKTESTYAKENPKRIYYLSMEFLIGRSLANNVTNLLLDPVVKRAVKERNLDW